MTKRSEFKLTDSQYEALAWALDDYLCGCEQDHQFRFIEDFPHNFDDAELLLTVRKYVGHSKADKLMADNA